MGLPQAQAEPEASADADGRASVAALSQEAARSARHSIELHVGEDGTANGWAGEAAQEAGLSSQAPAAASAAWDDAAHRWQRTRLVSRRAAARTDCDSGRCYQRDLLRAASGSRINPHGDGSAARSHRKQRSVLLVVQRPCGSFLRHAEAR